MKRYGVSKYILFFMVMCFSIGVSGTSVDAMDWDKSYSIVYDGKTMRQQAAYMDDAFIYLPCEGIGSYGDSSFITMDYDNKVMIVDLSVADFIFETADITGFIQENKTAIKIPLKYVEGEYYYPATLLEDLLGIQLSYENNKIYIEKQFGTMEMGIIDKDNPPVKPSLENRTVRNIDLNKGDLVEILKETRTNYKVKTGDNIICYIKKRYVDTYELENETIKIINQKREKFDLNEKISVLWEYVYYYSPDISEDAKIEAVDVLIPTWFYLSDIEGNIGNKADKKYVDDAHEKGYKVWGIFTNSFSPVITTAVLNDEALADKAVAQILAYASVYDLDGINIDFENIYYSDQQALVDFVEKLRRYTKDQGLVLSMDMTVPDGSEQWSKVFDRAQLQEHLDYIALMAYDEHWSSCQASGSVASLAWVERGVSNSLKTIPSEKLILGMPFYTRLWREYSENNQMKVSSKSMSMEAVKIFIAENQLEVKWLGGDTCQNYVEIQKDDALYRIWIEDEESLVYKAGFIEAYDLAGVAFWRKGFESKDIWDMVQTVVKDEKSYKKYAVSN